jgi:DNA processing protein
VRAEDPAYPPGLRALPDAPAVLYVRGTLPRCGVAVIGARDASARAQAFASAFVAALGEPLVSGLARGIDAAAHRAALAAALPQVAYVGTGLARTYPPEHAELAEAIVATGGALASELLPHAEVSDEALIRRDRLQAAHAFAVVLVETDAAGGAMHTMRFARAYGRPRFALACAAEGNRLAIADGAVPLPWDVDVAAAAVRAVRTC